MSTRTSTPTSVSSTLVPASITTPSGSVSDAKETTSVASGGVLVTALVDCHIHESIQ